MKILVTGGGGLLGSEVVRTARLRGLSPLAVRLKPAIGFISADITTDSGLASIRTLEWDVIIHTAAWRDPDTCHRDRAGAYAINARASERLGSLALERDARFVYISTDLVFTGDKPPYSENDTPVPVNYYGESKLAGETLLSNVYNARPELLSILRVPLLYGMAAGLQAAPLLVSTFKALGLYYPPPSSPWPMDDSIVRYPTYTGDVADAAMLIIDKKASGIFHFTGQDKFTRYRLTEAVAECYGKGMETVKRIIAPPSTEAKRPADAHLSMDRILKLGLPLPIPFRERIAMLKPEIDREFGA